MNGAGAMDRLRYRLLLVLLAPLLCLHVLWQAFNHRDLRYLRQRLGLYGRPGEPADLWLHAASVGEVNAALPLLRALREARPEARLLISTATPSGAAAAMRHLPPGTEHAFLPIDWPRAVAGFLRRFRPRCALVMETELWPHLYAACRRGGVPLVIVNGRLSGRTLGAAPWLRRLYGDCLAGVKAVLARSGQDGERFVALGADPARVEVVGNIKFAAPESPAEAAPVALARPYVLAASTREGEERLVVQAWQAAGRGDRLLVVAPRHPKRLAEILRELEPLCRRVAVRSRGEAITGETEVYLADTFGELTGFMAGAELVYMGGSLVPRGGHNILEPARLGIPVVFGPHMDNFADEAALLLEEGAAVQVASAEELGRTLNRLLADDGERRALGERARAVTARRRDMAGRYLAAVEALCPAAGKARP